MEAILRPEPRGWPDPANPGVPSNQEKAGPHLIVDEYSRRRWAWWTPHSNKTFGGWIHSAGGGRGSNWTYIGPAVTPDGQPVD
jgi:hypothetical protein